MAESTDLMVTEGAGNSAADASGQSGEKQSIVDKLANFDMLRQVVVIFGACYLCGYRYFHYALGTRVDFPSSCKNGNRTARWYFRLSRRKQYRI